MVSPPLQFLCHPDRDLVEHLVENLVAIMAVDDRPLSITIRQEVDGIVQESHTNRNATRVPGDAFTTLPEDKFAGGFKICHPVIIGTERAGKGPDADIEFGRDHRIEVRVQRAYTLIGALLIPLK